MAKVICPICGSDRIEISSLRVYNIGGAMVNEGDDSLYNLLYVQGTVFDWEPEAYYCKECEYEDDDWQTNFEEVERTMDSRRVKHGKK